MTCSSTFSLTPARVPCQRGSGPRSWKGDESYAGSRSHVDYVVEVILEVWKNRDRIQGLKLSHEAPFLRHFTARLEPVERALAS